jgi:hypothetical protein
VKYLKATPTADSRYLNVFDDFAKRQPFIFWKEGGKDAKKKSM